MIFISGDGANGIKNYTNCFPKAKFVLDPFHYIKKHLNYIFKDDIELRNIDDYKIRNDLLDNFINIVKYQITKFF